MTHHHGRTGCTGGRTFTPPTGDGELARNLQLAVILDVKADEAGVHTDARDSELHRWGLTGRGGQAARPG